MTNRESEVHLAFRPGRGQALAVTVDFCSRQDSASVRPRIGDRHTSLPHPLSFSTFLASAGTGRDVLGVWTHVGMTVAADHSVARSLRRRRSDSGRPRRFPYLGSRGMTRVPDTAIVLVPSKPMSTDLRLVREMIVAFRSAAAAFRRNVRGAKGADQAVTPRRILRSTFLP